VTVNNAGTLLDFNGKSETVANLSIVNATATMGAATPAGSAVLRTGTLAITGTGKLDVADNRLIVDYAAASPSPVRSVRDMVASAYAGGAWSGPGLTVASAVGPPAASRALGYAEAADVLAYAAGVASFAGQSIDNSAVVARLTLAGDANLDGAVDFNDLVRLAQNYNVADGQRVWSGGDFDYDGNVDFNDLVKLARNYNTSLPAGAIPGAPAGFERDLTEAMAAALVPEPNGVAASLAACGFLIAGRRARPKHAGAEHRSP
jgi:hypothetical protein